MPRWCSHQRARSPAHGNADECEDSTKFRRSGSTFGTVLFLRCVEAASAMEVHSVVLVEQPGHVGSRVRHQGSVRRGVHLVHAEPRGRDVGRGARSASVPETDSESVRNRFRKSVKTLGTFTTLWITLALRAAVPWFHREREVKQLIKIDLLNSIVQHLTADSGRIS